MDRTPSAERLSALDAAFLLFERPEQPLVVACVAELERPLEPALLLERLERLVAEQPRFGRRPVRTPLDLERPVWEDDPDFALIRHLRTADWPPPGDDAALRDVLEVVLSSSLRPDRPPWEIVSITGGEGGRAALVARVHHCMLDGMSGMRLLELLCDPASADGVGTQDGQGRREARRPRRGARRTWRAPAGDDAADPFSSPTAAPVWDHMRDIAELTSTVVSLLHDDPAPTTPLNAPLTRRRRAIWATFEQRHYGPLCAETGTTHNDVALAVISGALRRYLWRHDRGSSRRSLRALVPVSLRREEDEATLGNEVSAMFPRLPIDVADPLERLERIASEVRALRARGQPSATAWGLRMIEALPPVVEAALPVLVPPTPIVNTVCTHVPGPRESRSIAGSRIRCLHGIVPLFHHMAVEFAVLTHDRRMSICAHVDPMVLPHGDELAGDLVQSFAQLRLAEKRTRKHRREIRRLGALLRPVSRFASAREEPSEKPARRRSRRDRS